MRRSFWTYLVLSKKIPAGLTLAAGAMLFAYTTLRASMLSMTHDESGSFIFWNDYPIVKCLYSPECWRWANLHLLYVFFMKGTVALFGDSELAIRLPGLVGHTIYLVASYSLLRMLTNRHWMVFAGFVLLNFNPYLLEFFALARGYGLAMGFLMLSLFFFARYALTSRHLPVLGAFFAAGLGVLSNFTLLNFYACLAAIFTAVLVMKFLNTPVRSRQKCLAPVGWALLCSGITFSLIYNPIRFLQASGEFEWGVDSFSTTVRFLAHCSLYGKRYFNQFNNEIFAGLTLAILVGSIFLAGRQLVRQPGSPKAQVWLAVALLPFLAAFISIAQHYLLGSQYPVNRTALMFIPITALPVFLLLKNRVENWRKGKILAGVVTVFCLFHFLISVQLRSSAEWSYDSQTKAMMFYLHEKLPPGQKIKLGVNWHFHPTANFYLTTVPMTFCDPLVYSKDIRTDSLFDYYFVFPADTATLHKDYVLEKNFDDTAWLMKRK